MVKEIKQLYMELIIAIVFLLILAPAVFPSYARD